MARKNSRNTKGRIVSAAWKLFYDQGYENTTVEDIIAASGTSKGSFYHYFEGKDALLETLSILFDEKYEELMGEIDDAQNRFDVLLYMNRVLFTMIENTVSIELLARMLSTQLITRGERHLLDRSRTYYRVLRKLIRDGQERDEISREMTVDDAVKYYAMCERALMYDWCICGGEYSLRDYAEKSMPQLLTGFRIN